MWGPPGTGKTTVLKRAIGDLIARGDRVLLVSATNIAVDNALLGVVKEQRHAPGEIVRVGPPQLREVADDPGVSLPLMVRERLAETAERRRKLEAELVGVRARASELAELESSLVRFDPTAYFAALKLLRTPGQDPVSVQERAEKAASLWQEAVAAQDVAEEAAVTAERQLTGVADDRRKWLEVERLRQAAADALHAAEGKEAEGRRREAYLAELREALRQLDEQGPLARWRTRGERQELEEHVALADEDAARAHQAAQAKRATAEADIARLEKEAAEMIAGISHTPEQITALEKILASAESAHRSAVNLVSARREERPSWSRR